MVHRKRGTPGRTPKNKAGKLKTEEEEETPQKSTQNEGQDTMQILLEEELNKYADQNATEKAEVDQKVAGAAEANEINIKDKLSEPKDPEKVVSAKKNRKRNAAKLVAGAKSPGTLPAVTVDIDKLAALPKSSVIVPAESKNAEIVAEKPKSEENVKLEKKNEEIVEYKQINVKSEQTSVHKAKFEIKSPQKVKTVQKVLEEELNRFSDQNAAEKAEVDQKVAGAAEANEINTEEKSSEPKDPEKVVSAKKNRKRNAAKLVASARSAGTLTAETVDIEKLAAEPKSEVILAAESKNAEIVAEKPKSEENVKLEKKNEEIVEYKLINVKSERKSVLKAKIEMKSPQKVKADQKVLKDAKADEATAEKVELQRNNLENVESEQRDLQTMQKTTGEVEGDVAMKNVEKLEAGHVSTTKIDTQQENGMSKTQLKKLRRLQQLKYCGKADAEKKSTAMAEENNSKKVEEDSISEKVEVDANNSYKAGPEKKSVEGVEIEVFKQVAADHKHVEVVEGEVVKPAETEQKITENVDAQQNNSIGRTQLKKLRKLEALKRREKAEAEKQSTIEAVAENNDLEKSEADLKNSEKARPEQNDTANIDAQQDNGISKKLRKLRKLEALKNREKVEIDKNSVVEAFEEDSNLENNADLKNSEKVRPEKKNIEKAGSEKKKSEGVKGKVVKQVEAEVKSTANGDAQQNNGPSKRQRKKLRQLEQINNLEKAEKEEDNGLSGQHNWMLKKLERNKKAEEDIEIIVKMETKVTEETETKQTLSEKMEINGTVEKKLEIEQSKGKRKKSKKRKRANKEKEEKVKKSTEEEGQGKKIMEEERVKKITEEERQVRKITHEEGQVKKMEFDGTIEKKPENDQSKSKSKKNKKRNRANIEKEGQVKKTAQEEIAMKKKQKKCDATEAIDMLVDSLSKDELSEILSFAVQKHSDLLSHINGVASRYQSTRKIFVGHLKNDTNSGMLRKVFSQYGQIEMVETIEDKEAGKCKCFGIVEFKSKSSALSALTDPIKEINDQQSYCTVFRPKSSINSHMAVPGPAGFFNPAIHGPGGFVNPIMLGPGGYINPTVLGPGGYLNPTVFGPGRYVNPTVLDSTFPCDINPHAVLDNFHSPNQWGHSNLQYEYSDGHYEDIECVERCGCDSTFCVR